MGKATILIVEDEAIVAADLASKLSQLGYAVCGTAERGEEAIVLARDRRPDLVLMDIRLAGPMDGVAAAERIRRECDIPVVYLTAQSDSAMLERALRTEPFGYILKPFQQLELKPYLEVALYKHQAERKLRQSEERFRKVFDHAATGIAITDSAGRFVQCNAAYSGLIGYSPAELAAMDFPALIHPDDREHNLDLIRRLLDGTIPSFEIEARYRRKDGAQVWVHKHVSLLSDDCGPGTHIVALVTDITERRQIEDTLRFLVSCGSSPSGEDFFQELARYLAQLLNMGFVCIDRLEEGLLAARTLAVFSDGKFEDNISYTLKDTPCGHAAGQRICCFPKAVRQLFPNDKVLQEMRAESYLGVTLWSAQEKPIGLIAVIGRQPLGNTRQAEAILQLVAVRAAGELERRQVELQRLEAKDQAERRARELSGVFGAMTDGVVILNADGVTVDVNEAWVEACGVNPIHQRPEQAGRGLNLRTMDGRPLRPEQWPCNRALTGEVVRAERLAFTAPGGDERVVVASAAPLRAQGEVTGAVVVWHDVTERETLLQNVAAARENLEVRVEERTHELKEVVEKLRLEAQVRQETEQALAESEERYRKLFEAAPLGIAITDDRGEIHAFNHSLCQMLGVSADEMIHQQMSQFYADPAGRKQLLALAKRTGKIEDWEARLRRKDGTTFFASLHLDHVKVRDRLLRLTIAQDLTKRKQAEKHVEGLRALLECFATKPARTDYLNSVVGLLRDWCDCHGAGLRLCRPDGHLPYAAHTGFSREFLKRESAILIGALDCACVRVNRGQPQPEDLDCSNARCAYFCNHVSGLPGRAAPAPPALACLPCVQAGFESLAHVPIRYHGQLVGAIHLADRRPGHFPPEAIEFIEATAPLLGEALHRFQIEEHLRESEHRFRSMFESHAASMLLIDPESGLIVDANPTAARYFGYTLEQLRSMRMEDLNNQADRRPAAQAEVGRLGFQIVHHRLASGAVRAAEVHSSPVEVDGRRLLFSVLHDITERKQLEGRILEIGEEERRRIGQDLHDSLGGHLTGLALLGKGLATALAARGLPESDIAGELAQGMNEAISQTRSISRGLCPINLATLGLATSLVEYARTVSKRLGVECRVRTRGPVELQDEGVAAHLFRIVQEAVNNAVRHGKARRILIELAQEEGALRLTVRDNGRGLPPDVERAQGMGLRTMRYRADMLGARLEISSRPGKETLISCRLPCQTSAEPNERSIA